MDVYRRPEQYEGVLIRLCGSKERLSPDSITDPDGYGRAPAQIRLAGRSPKQGCAKGRLKRDTSDNLDIVIADYGGLRGWVFVSIQ